MIWLTCTEFSGQTILINLTHIVAIRPNHGGGGSRLQAYGNDEKGKIITFVVQESPTSLMQQAARHSS